MYFYYKCGDMVAAFLPQNGEKCWILATVLGFENEKYQLEDADVDSANRKLGMKKELVKPLPLMKADPITCPKAFFKPNQFGNDISLVMFEFLLN